MIIILSGNYVSPISQDHHVGIAEDRNLKYGVRVISNGMFFEPSLMKIGHFIQMASEEVGPTNIGLYA
jgi:hypothetical protein